MDDDSDDDVMNACRPGEDDENPRDLTLHEQRDRGGVSRCCLITKSPPPPGSPEPSRSRMVFSYHIIGFGSTYRVIEKSIQEGTV